jgi:hypothetical protein
VLPRARQCHVGRSDRSVARSSLGRDHTSPKLRTTPLPTSLSTPKVSLFASAVESEASGRCGDIATSRAPRAVISDRVTAVPRTKLPRLLDLSDMQAETAALVMALNGLGTRRSGAVLASMYRHLAHWPSYLSFAWLLLAPLDADGRLAIAIQQAQHAASARGDRLSVRLRGSEAPPQPALAVRISAAIEPFVGDVIVKMLVICAFLRRAAA